MRGRCGVASLDSFGMRSFQRTRSFSHDRLLDDLDESATYLISERKGLDGLCILEREGRYLAEHWSKTNPKLGSTGSDFLYLAVIFGLTKYVDHRMREKCLSPERVKSLLLVAVNVDAELFRVPPLAFHDTDSQTKDTTWEFLRSKPDMELVSLLLGYLGLPESEISDLLQRAELVVSKESFTNFQQRLQEVPKSSNPNGIQGSGIQILGINRFRTSRSAVIPIDSTYQRITEVGSSASPLPVSQAQPPRQKGRDSQCFPLEEAKGIGRTWSTNECWLRSHKRWQ
jgi:hypothetical protein